MYSCSDFVRKEERYRWGEGGETALVNVTEAIFGASGLSNV